MKMSMMYQKLVLGMARHFAKAESRKQLEVLGRGKLVAAAGSEGVNRRSRLEDMARGLMQYLTVDCGEKEMVKPSDLSALPDNLSVEVLPPAATKVVVGGIMATDMDRNWGVQASMHVSIMMEGKGYSEVV